MSRGKYTKLIKAEARRLGFGAIGISRSEKMEEESRNLERYLKNGFHGTMSYMENYFDKRTDPRLLVPGSKSVVSLAYNYYTDKEPFDGDSLRISKYAYGMDYHFVVKEKLRELMSFIHEKIGVVEGRIFVDSAPVLERDWAKRSGLGWIGKNAMLIQKGAGSFFFLSELIIDLELEYDNPMASYCGSCRKCIEECPTEAIDKNGFVIDGSKCISYLTIELKEDRIPEEMAGKLGEWIFGCDICQDICPWNRFSTPHSEPNFLPNNGLMEMRDSDWLEITEEIYREIFRKTPVKRAKFKGLKRNIEFALSFKKK